MFGIVIVSCVFVACLGAPQGNQAAAGPPQTPTLRSPPPAQGVYCGEAPNNLFECLENPNFLKKETTAKCNVYKLSECDAMKCFFRESGWAEAEDKVNKQKVAQFFNDFTLTNGNWTSAVQHLKIDCLDKELPPQGATHACPAYDVMHCILISFLRNAPESAWRTTPACVYPRQYAAACPYCPASCFAPQVPQGTCNACLSLPRTS